MELNFSQQEAWWDSMVILEEVDIGDEAINRGLRWKEIEKHLQGVKTILDVGAGTGAFSIPLAERGFQVTHVDFSSAMLERAQLKTKHQEVKNIQFIKANAIDLSIFPDRSFDFVLNMDGAISFCGPFAETSIKETCRVARKKVLLTVSHRAALLPFWVIASFEQAGRFVPAVYSLLEKGTWDPEEFPENSAMSRALTGEYLGPIKAFLPSELRIILEKLGMNVLRLGGLGSLSYLMGTQTIKDLGQDSELLRTYAELCDYFDQKVFPDGPGSRQRAGLMAVAEWPA